MCYYYSISYGLISRNVKSKIIINAVTYILTCVTIEVYRNKSETIKIKILIHATNSCIY